MSRTLSQARHQLFHWDTSTHEERGVLAARLARALETLGNRSQGNSVQKKLLCILVYLRNITQHLRPVYLSHVNTIAWNLFPFSNPLSKVVCTALTVCTCMGMGQLTIGINIFLSCVLFQEKDRKLIECPKSCDQTGQ